MNDIYARLEEQKGRAHQIAVAIEEMSELTKELTKHLRSDSYTSNKKIAEEIADVEIVVEQLKRFFDPDNIVVPLVKQYKLERLKLCYLDTSVIGPTAFVAAQTFKESLTGKDSF